MSGPLGVIELEELAIGDDMTALQDEILGLLESNAIPQKICRRIMDLVEEGERQALEQLRPLLAEIAKVSP
jgi:hypothetical protein